MFGFGACRGWVFVGWRLSGGVRDRNKLERAADAYSKVISLQGPRATANALRGLAYTRMWLNRSEAEAFEPLETGLKNGVWVTRGQYPGEVDRALAQLRTHAHQWGMRFLGPPNAPKKLNELHIVPM